LLERNYQSTGNPKYRDHLLCKTLGSLVLKDACIMKQMKLQDLLAATWRERARAEDAFLTEVGEYFEETGPWPEEVQDEIASLKPSPEVFLSAFVAFWAEVAARQYVKRLKQIGKKVHIEPNVSAGWSSPHLAAFPMTPAEVPDLANMMRGVMVWKLIDRLGHYAGAIEPQLIACLYHPEPVVRDAAESALGTSDAMTDQGFAQFLAAADARGGKGFTWQGAKAIAGHVCGSRIDMVLDGLEPSAPANVSEARLLIIRQLKGDNAQAAWRCLKTRIADSWSTKQLSAIIPGLQHLCGLVGIDADVVSMVERLVTHNDPDIRSAAAEFLANLSSSEHLDILKRLVLEAHPWVLIALCRGLTGCKDISPDLLRAVASRCLGNGEGFDDEPHDSAVRMLTKLGKNAGIVLPEIVTWLDQASSSPDLEREDIVDALDIADALGELAGPLKPGLQRMLRWMTPSESEEPEELPTLNQPEDIPKIQTHIEKSMLEAGTDPGLAKAQAELNGAIMDALVTNQDKIQAEIDRRQSEYEAEQRDLYPEQDTTDGGTGQEPLPLLYSPTRVKLLVRLRGTIERLERLARE
jgi:hypothetical protein